MLGSTRVAVLFDGAGLARLGLEQAGLGCTGFELNPVAHYLSTFVGSGNCVLVDVKDVALQGYDAIWASPPCQKRSSARTQGAPVSAYADNLLDWCLKIDKECLWVENILSQRAADNLWGVKWNAAQFEAAPRQCRNRVIGGCYPRPEVFREYQKAWPGVCPCITASEYRGCATDARRASRFYGRKLTLEECAWHQGFEIPEGWYVIPAWYEPPAHPVTGKRDSPRVAWTKELYTAIGNGVPPYVSRAFGEALAKLEQMR